MLFVLLHCVPCFPYADAGLGLWTTRFYPKSALITEYCGTIVSFQHARRLREAQQDSHIRVLSSFHECIDGIKEQQPGLGGASIANDARNSRKNNAMPPVPVHSHGPSTPTRTPSRTPPNTWLVPCQLHGAASCSACCSPGQHTWQLLSPQHSPSAVLRAKLSPFAMVSVSEAGGIDSPPIALWGSSTVQRRLCSPQLPAGFEAAPAAAQAAAAAPAGAASPSGARWTNRGARQTTMAVEHSSPVPRSRRRLYSRSALRPDCDLKSPAMHQQQQQQEPPSAPTPSAAGKGHTGCTAQHGSSSSLESQCLDLDEEDTTCSADEHTKQKQKLGATAWSPSRWPKTHVMQEQQQPSRPQRRRRAPDPERQYNGTVQAAKPIEGWW